MGRYLEAFTVLETRQVEELRGALYSVYDANCFDHYGNQRQFYANAAYFDFGSSKLSYGSHKSEIRVGFRDDDYIRIQICMFGGGRTSAEGHETDVEPGTIVCSPANAVLEFGRSLRHFVLRIDRAKLERDLASLLGTRPKKRITFSPAIRGDAGQTGRFRDHVFHVAANIDSSSDPIPSPLLRELDQTIRISALYGIANNFSDMLSETAKMSAPWQVRRIEEWIDDHWHEDVSIEKLVDISGASLRSIFATFKNTRGYTPMAYLKAVRLNAARKMLLIAAPETTVTGTGLICNFMNTSHFAREYKRHFGELPSETLRRGRIAWL